MRFLSLIVVVGMQLVVFSSGGAQTVAEALDGRSESSSLLQNANEIRSALPQVLEVERLRLRPSGSTARISSQFSQKEYFLAGLLAASLRDPEMVEIPAGEFVMGSKEGPADALAHRVRLSGFWLDATEVTNAQYFVFCQATGHRLPEFWGRSEYRCGLDFPNHPVVGVSWHDARDYAEWAGKRLPTEAEWEYAARGGLVGKLFPNGDELKPEAACFKGSLGTFAVASFPANGFGLYDMAGNVVEWVADVYSDRYQEEELVVDPSGPEKGKLRVIRGGGWHSGVYCNRVYHRNALPQGWVDFAVGFRCAADRGFTEATAVPETDCGDEDCGQDGGINTQLKPASD